jgi:hypothetical protein
MPRPVYIVCSESGSEDRTTGLGSIFNVIDKIQFERLPQGAVGVAGFQFRITAVWKREPGDEGQEFDYEVALTLPATANELRLASGTLVFSRPLHRLTTQMQGPPPLQGEGELRAISRIRRSGTQDWLSQEYPVLVEEIRPPAEPNQAGQNGS